jgi:hypothetical protein
MKSFDIGFVPHGWERGEELLFNIGSQVAWVSQKYAPLLKAGDEIDTTAVALVTYCKEDEPRVKAWLDWWNAPTGRQSGTTSQQMREAADGAVYVWCNTRLAYPINLAAHLGRNLTIVRPSWLLKARGRIDAHIDIVVDHAAQLTRSESEALFYLRKWLDARKAA